MGQQSPWNSLEITKLVIDVLTPLGLLLLGIWVNRLAHRIESVQWANQKVVEKRITIYDELAPLLNDLYCYFQFVGNWKELTPLQIIEIKRKLDKKVHVYAPLFSQKFMTLYNDFIPLCFKTYTGIGHDAKLRTSLTSNRGDRRQSRAFNWDDSWDGLFLDDKECSDRKEIRSVYEHLMLQFAQELGIGLQPALPPIKNKNA